MVRENYLVPRLFHSLGERAIVHGCGYKLKVINVHTLNSGVLVCVCVPIPCSRFGVV